MELRKQARISVVGSLVMDLVVWLPHFPRRGETLHPTRFAIFAGGKGFNQAVTARRLGASVGMIGRVGRDAFGDRFVEHLRRERIDPGHIRRDEELGTSLGIPMIDPQGENSIIGIPLANTRLSPEDIEAGREVIEASQVMLLQLEIPVATSLHAAAIACQAGAAVILNPAPAHLPVGPFFGLHPGEEPHLDWLIANEVEAEMLSGIRVADLNGARQAARAVQARGLRKGVVITLGAQGALVVTREVERYGPAFPVQPVDPTGAGDAFCGAWAVAVAEGMPLEEALRFANAAGALCVTKAGAEPSLPTREAVDAFLSGKSG
jgi:ribokinase